MIHDFGIVWSERSLLLSGLGNTTILSVLSATAAVMLGFVLTPALMSKQRWIAGSARGFVDVMRCVPFLLFAYIAYYGLPSLGIRLDNWTSGLLALTIYNAAYMAEILRGAWSAQPREPIEAGVAFGFSNAALFRRIVLPPLLLAAGLAGTLVWLKRRQSTPADLAPLNPEESRRLEGLMRGTDA